MDLYRNVTTNPVSGIELKAVVDVDPGMSVADVLALMQREQAGSVLVCREGRLAGIFTERDTLRIIATGQDTSAPIESVMTANPVTVRATDSVGTAIARMHRGGHRRLPMVDEDGRPVGVVTVAGLVRYLVEYFPASVYNLPPVAQHTTRDREGA